MKHFILLVKRFSPYFKDYIPQFSLAIFGMILTAIATASIAYMIKPVLDEIFINKDETLLYILPFGVVFVYTLKGIGTYMQVYYTAFIGQDIIRKLRDRLLSKILTFEMSFFHQYRSGELISRTINDIERVRLVVSNMIPLMIREVLTIFALSGYLIYLDPIMAFFALIILPIALKPLSILAKKMKSLSHAVQEKTSDITSRLSEIFNNIEVIKASGAQKYELDRFKTHNEKIFKINIKSTRTGELVTPIMETIGAIGAALIIIIGGKEVIDGNMSVGSFFSFMAALFMLYTPVKRVSKLYNQTQDAIAASERIYYVLDRKTKIVDGVKTIKDKIESIKFQNVSLSFNNETALKNINFEIKAGEKVALVGSSGSGKSSIANLILRFYDPSDGEILINDIDLKEYSLKSLRETISVVTQRVYIFNDTVAANVAYSKAIDEQKVIQALKDANAWEFVQKLDNGIYTTINEFGTNLSGGQRQRVAIARAIYNNPKILIFDEATSALDSKSEEKITNALKTVTKDKITFIIAHRLSTIKDADKIIVLKDGKIVSIGKNSELLKSSKEFQHLSGLQI